MQEDKCLKLFIDPSSVTAFSYTMLLTALYPLQGTLCVRQEYILDGYSFGEVGGHQRTFWKSMWTHGEHANLPKGSNPSSGSSLKMDVQE